MKDFDVGKVSRVAEPLIRAEHIVAYKLRDINAEAYPLLWPLQETFDRSVMRED